MELMPIEVAVKLPIIYKTENNPDPVALVKFFTPDSDWTWYVWEYDPAERVCYGLVTNSACGSELGYFSIPEMEKARGLLGLPIERDLYWEPMALSEIMMRIRRLG